jgi:hypothetical protein
VVAVRLTRIWLAALAVVLVAGCAADGRDGGQDQPRAGAMAAATPPRELALPLDPYQPSPSQVDLLARARHLLVARSMRRLGVDPPPPAPAVPSRRPATPSATG